MFLRRGQRNRSVSGRVEPVYVTFPYVTAVSRDRLHDTTKNSMEGGRRLSSLTAVDSRQCAFEG